MANNRRGGAKRKPRQPAPQQGAAHWGWFVGGLIPGLAIALLVHLHHERDDSLAVVAPGPDRAESGGDDEGRESSGRPRFEFYELLSEMEVVVPDEPEPEPGPAEQPGVSVPEQAAPQTPQTPAPAPEEPPQAPAEAESDARYMVQAGSFQSHEDADQLKARLALMGVQADIQSVEVESGETWHRVRIGPFRDRDQVDSLRSQLQDADMDSILLRMRG